MRRTAAALTLLALVLAGCTSGGASKATPTSAAPATTHVGVDVDGGIVEGAVADDEASPIAGVRVAFLELEAEVVTDDAGAFRFQSVPAGTYSLAAERLGYESVVKRVTVVAGEAVRVTFLLKGLVIGPEPHFLSIQRNTLHHIGETYVTFAINLTGQSPMCEGCVFTLHLPRVPSFVFWEVFGKHTVQSPNGDKEHIWVYTNGGNGAGGTHAGEVEGLLPVNLTLGEAPLKTLDKKKPLLWFQLLCENFWVCVEERRESWVTSFYDYEEIPEGFSARPKA